MVEQIRNRWASKHHSSADNKNISGINDCDPFYMKIQNNTKLSNQAMDGRVSYLQNYELGQHRTPSKLGCSQ
jgi:hypothetical protein